MLFTYKAELVKKAKTKSLKLIQNKFVVKLIILLFSGKLNYSTCLKHRKTV